MSAFKTHELAIDEGAMRVDYFAGATCKMRLSTEIGGGFLHSSSLLGANDHHPLPPQKKQKNMSQCHRGVVLNPASTFGSWVMGWEVFSSFP